MVRLIRAEFIKLRTTQVWFWLLLAVVAIGALIAIATLATKGSVRSAADVPDIFGSANVASVATFVLGALAVTTEFRYQTITPTVLATPSRWRLVTAKMIAYTIVGAGYAAACIGVQLAIAVPWLSSKHLNVSFSDPNLRRAVFGLFAVLALFALVGIGIGALLRNQIVAVSVGLIFLLVLQNIVLAIPKVRQAWPYTPSGATSAILFTDDGGGPGGIHLVSPLAGLLLLLAWALVPAILGAGITMNRDIT